MRFSWQAQLRGPQERAVRKQLRTAQSRAPFLHYLGKYAPWCQFLGRGHICPLNRLPIWAHAALVREQTGSRPGPTESIWYVEEWAMSVCLSVFIWFQPHFIFDASQKKQNELVFLQNHGVFSLPEEIYLIRLQRLRLSVHSSQSTIKCKNYLEWWRMILGHTQQR